MTEEVVAGLLASAISFVLGLGWSRMREKWRLRVFASIWRPFLARKKVAVVLTTRAGPYARSTARVSLSELKAFVSISETLDKLKLVAIPIGSDCRLDEISGEQLILLGGPAANSVTAEIWRLIEGRLPFAFDSKTSSLACSGRVYSPEVDSEGHLVKDYAVIMRASAPFASRRPMLLCCGCHGFGTLGAAIAITDRVSARRLSRSVAATQDFCAVLEIAIRHGAIGPPVVRELFVLPPLAPGHGE